MHIVTDSGVDLSPQQRDGLDIHQLPLMITLDGKTYRSGIDVQVDEFYDLLAASPNLPKTSMPSPGDFAEVYRELAKTDPEILSVHISSGLSGTAESARVAAGMVEEAQVTLVDTLTLSAAQGWQVEAAARAAKAGWPMARILELVRQVREATETVYTLPDLTYLIHGGRISHMKGLLASMLKIAPLIGVSKTDGKYYMRGKKRGFSRALTALVDVMAQDHAEGTKLRVQLVHINDPEGEARLHEAIAARFECEWLPTSTVAPALGAHTGPGLVGVIYAASAALPEMP